MTTERRRHPRIKLLAQVSLTRDGQAHVLSTLDVSLSGLFVAVDPAGYPDMVVGSEAEIVLHPTPELAEQGAEKVQARARVARIETGGVRHAGFGLEITRIDADNMLRLGSLLKKFTDAAHS